MARVHPGGVERGVGDPGGWLWIFLAAIYALPLQLLCYYTDRRLTLSGAWKLAAAALLPGALCMDATILAYAFGYLALLKFLALVADHFLVGWIFAVGGCLRRPRVD